MYITEELFESADPTYSPGTRQTDSHEPLGKRKRTATDDVYTANFLPTKNLKLASLLDEKYAEAPATASLYNYNHLAQQQPQQQRPRKRAVPHPRLHVQAQHLRSRPPLQNVHQNCRTILNETTTKATSSPSTPDLNPCHCCHRSPHTKKDLEGYMACEACGARTCFICLRQCVGSRCGDGAEPSAVEKDAKAYGIGNGCGGRKICRACCVERGEEGDTWCLRCLEGEGEDTIMG
ncbi:uncharacterized protein J3D65DRAFT_214916 [Phyllosticta citribraziliensis]|uniref:Uncharacterized protein n=1 Tax=Phyllosticta citribraziliensis TaxID=989973 RepID=A0ABR1M5V7_9PEZI